MRTRGSLALPVLATLVTLGVLIAPVTATGPAKSAPASATPTATDGRRGLPRDLVPSLDDAPRIRPQAYADGCHAKAGVTRARACSYGVKDGGYSVLLIGDSHAVQWLPALEDLADREGWRLYSLTKSACPVPRTTVIVRGERLPDCDRWREAAFDRVARIHPDLVIAASLGRIYELPGGGTRKRHDRLWREAWVDSLEELRRGSEAVVLLGDTPMWLRDPIACLRRHRHDIDRCDTPRDKALSARTDGIERAAASEAGVAFLPTADLVCPGDPCRAVDGRYLVLGDIQHMTVAWARLIAPRLLDRLACVAPSSLSGAPSSHSGAPSPLASGVAAGPSAVPGASPGPSVPSASPGPSVPSASPGPSVRGTSASASSPGASPSSSAVPSDLPGRSPSLSCPR